MTFDSIKNNLSSVWEKTGYEQLEQREKVFVGIGGLFLILFLLLQLVVIPFFSARQRLVRSVDDKKSALVKIVDLQKRYRQLQGTAERSRAEIAGHGTGFSLFSFVEDQAIRADVKKQMLSMRPLAPATDGNSRESAVEVKLHRVSLGRLVAFLKLVENPDKMVFVHSISIQESTGANFVDVILQVATIIK